MSSIKNRRSKRGGSLPRIDINGDGNGVCPLLPTTTQTIGKGSVQGSSKWNTRFTTWGGVAGLVGCWYVSFVVLAGVAAAVLRASVASLWEIQGSVATAPPAPGESAICYSAIGEDPLAAQLHGPPTYRHDGNDRIAPLKKKTRWIPDQPEPNDATTPRWSWPQDVAAQEDGPDLWYVRGIPYDLSDFAHEHPGGFRYILNNANKDITELFESHHIGTTASKKLEELRHGSPNVEGLPPYLGHRSERFRELKEFVRSNFDLNDLKEPTREYTVLFWLTLAAHALLYWACLVREDWKNNGGAADKPDAFQRRRGFDFAHFVRRIFDFDFFSQPRPNPWFLHGCLGVTGAWLSTFGHNGLHLWSRRPTEALAMYLFAANNPFRWMVNHLNEHHMYTNTAFDYDKSEVGQFQVWRTRMPMKFALAVAFPSLLSQVPRQTPSTVNPLEPWVPFIILALILAAGIKLQGAKRWIPRHLFTLSIMCQYVFCLGEVAHLQPQVIDGDNVHATVDDWAEFQLRTTWGWDQLEGSLFSMIFLNVNFQPGHHVFPAVHHSKLRELTPAIRAFYPGLMEDHSFPRMVVHFFKFVFGLECVQKVGR